MLFGNCFGKWSRHVLQLPWYLSQCSALSLSKILPGRHPNRTTHTIGTSKNTTGGRSGQASTPRRREGCPRSLEQCWREWEHSFAERKGLTRVWSTPRFWKKATITAAGTVKRFWLEPRSTLLFLMGRIRYEPSSLVDHLVIWNTTAEYATDTKEEPMIRSLSLDVLSVYFITYAYR